MSKYVPGYTGPMLPAAGPRSAAPTPNPRLVNPASGGTIATPKPAPANVNPRPGLAPKGPTVPVRGGGMAPASVATMMKKGGKVSSASKRADGCVKKGKTKGRII